jgi:type VI secretion system protein ImpH
MGASGRRTGASVEDLLFRRGCDFGFFQAVRLLAYVYPQRRQVGGEARPSSEIARFCAHLSMSFPPGAIHRIDRTSEGDRPATMTVAFMGLTGPQGVLPSHYTEILIARQAEKDSALAAFLDLFNHRLVSLFYRAWEKHHFVIGYERSARAAVQDESFPHDDKFTQYLFDLIGMGTPALRRRLGVRDQALLRYAGLIAQRPHSASALGGMLRDYFDLPVEIEQVQGKWFPLDKSNLSFLQQEGVQTQLGVGAIAGDAVWNQQARFRIQVGPISLERFIDFLPDGHAFAELIELARYFVGLAFEFDVQLILRARDVPWCRLTDESADAPRLGWLGWLKTAEFGEHASEAVFDEHDQPSPSCAATAVN